MEFPGVTIPRPFATIGFLCAWLVPWRPAFRTTASSGLVFHVHHRDAVGRHVAKYGIHEPLVTRWMADFLGVTRRGIVVDVGANFGWHALHAARHPNIDMVVAFEPDRFNAWLLDRNLTENRIDNVIADTRAVGAQRGVTKFYRYKGSNRGRHSLTADHGFGSTSVLITDLDGALADAGLRDAPVALIKIDVEGAEPAVIACATQTLQRTEAVILEYSPELSRAGGLSLDEMLTRLTAFTPFVLCSNGGTYRIGFDELRPLEGVADVIFVRTERLPSLAAGMNEVNRGGRSLNDILAENMRVKVPLGDRPTVTSP